MTSRTGLSEGRRQPSPRPREGRAGETLAAFRTRPFAVAVGGADFLPPRLRLSGAREVSRGTSREISGVAGRRGTAVRLAAILG